MTRETLELYGPWFKHPDGRFVDASELPKEDGRMARQADYHERHGLMLKEMADLPVPAIELQALAAYDASDRHIPDSDLDDEQPITLLVSTTLGEVRRIRRMHAMIARGAELVAEDERARIAYEDSL